MSKKEIFKNLISALKDARENGVNHIAFINSLDGKDFTTSMNCNGDDLYDYLYSLCIRDEVFFEVIYSVVTDIMEGSMTDDEDTDKAN